MHPNLPEWYKLVQIEVRPANVQALSEISDEVGDDLSIANLPEFVRMAYGLPARDEPTRRDFRERLVNADAAIGFKDDFREIGILAGASLMRAFSDDADAEITTAAALLLTSAHASLGAPPSVPFFTEQARLKLRELASAERSADMTPERGSKTEVKYPQANSYPTDPASWAETTLKAVHTIGNRTANIEKIHRAVLAQGEMIDTMWWLLGGSSTLTGAPFSKMSLGAAAVILGHDLASLNQYSVPFQAVYPIAVQAIGAAGFEDGPVKLTQAVADAVAHYGQHAIETQEWNLPVGVESLADLLPVTAALLHTTGRIAQSPQSQEFPAATLAWQLCIESATVDAANVTE